MLNLLFEIRLSPLQGLKLQSFFIHSASHHAIAKALSEQLTLLQEQIVGFLYHQDFLNYEAPRIEKTSCHHT